jgi:spermidine synthase
MSALIVVLFFLSGATALMGEVVWMRMLGLVLGNTVWAASAAVAVWMAGMAVGARIGGRLAPKIRRHLRTYGLLEGAIGLFFAASPAVHRLLLDLGRGLGEDLGGALAWGLAQRFLLAAVALAVPTVLMGATLPLLVERLHGSVLARRVGLLYGINTLGAATGVLVTAYWVLPILGERGSLAAASLTCATVAAVAVLAAGKGGAAATPVVPGARGLRDHRTYAVLVAAMGCAALAAELVWVRVLVLHLGSRVYAFALLLGVYLIGIAVGSLLMWALASRVGSPTTVLARVQLAAGATLLLQVPALAHFGGIVEFFLGFAGGGLTFAHAQMVFFAAVAVVFLPATVLFGVSFPLAVAAHPGNQSPGEHTGAVAAANTVGGILGAVVAPFVLVPWIGCQWTMLVLALIHMAVAVGLGPRPAVRRMAAAMAAGAVVVAVVAPRDWMLRRVGAQGLEGELELVSLEESLSATVLVTRHIEELGTWLSLELNGVNVAGTEPALQAVQQLQGHLPLLQVPDARRVLHIGFGSGGTCWAVSRHPVEEIVVVEISPEVLTAADTYFPDVNHHVLDDPRVRVVVNDGRNFLLATEQTFDVILSDSIHPVYAGNSTLYTREYFELCRERLNPGGVVSMWLPLYSLDRESYLRIVTAFQQVFPNTTVWYDVSTANEYSVVTGRVEGGPLEIEWERMHDPDVAASLAVAGVRAPGDLARNLLVSSPAMMTLLAEVDPHVDDLPFVEYTAGRVLAREATWKGNLVLLYTHRARQSAFRGAFDEDEWRRLADDRDERLASIIRGIRSERTW